MTLRVVGAGLPRTGTSSLRQALGTLFSGEVLHMHALPGHPFDLGTGWQTALAGGTPDWDALTAEYVAAVDWPASQFWRELSAAHPNALILLSVRHSAQTWVESVQATILPHARACAAPGWTDGRDLATLFERFAGTPHWDDPVVLANAYDRYNADVQASAPSDRLLVWQASQGWEPICRALGVSVPQEPFPWTNQRQEWG